MALVRILVDGYSLLHAWPELLNSHAPHSARARDALIDRLTRYHDAVGTPITLFFDGQGAPTGAPKPVSNRKVEILYSPAGRTADDLIERVTHRLLPYGEVLVVTNDIAERDTVVHLGGHTQSCEGFINEVESAVGQLESEIRLHNRRERDRYQR